MRFFYPGPSKDDFQHISRIDRGAFILSAVESASTSTRLQIISVVGIGLLVSAYALLSINLVVPILDIVYYHGSMPHSFIVALNVVTLGGAIFGHVGFGFLADQCGRRKLFGTSLTIIIGATTGTALSSTGIGGSISFIALLLAWRFVLGIGIGGQTSLGAIICAEYVPSRHRGISMANVFCFQPWGQLAVCLVTLAVLASHRDGVLGRLDSTNCTVECMKTLDSTWRWIIGAIAIPAFLIKYFVKTIPESPRFVVEVVGMSVNKQVSYIRQFYEVQTSHSRSGSTFSLPRFGDQTHGNAPMLGNFGVESVAELSIPSGVARLSTESQVVSELELARSIDEVRELESEGPIYASKREALEYFWHQGNLRTLIATSLSSFCLELPYYGLLLNTPQISAVLWDRTSPGSIYHQLMRLAWQSGVSAPLAAMGGSALTYLAITKFGRRNIQMVGFTALLIIFVIIGTSFRHLARLDNSSAMIVLYMLGQLFFTFGPASTTYILPAELFPTRYRGLSHGISAAFGKLGAIIAQLFLGYVHYGHGENYTQIAPWLSYSVLIFVIPLVIGLVVTVCWIPGAEYGEKGGAKTLEEWAVGRLADRNGSTGEGKGTAIKRWYHRFA